MGFRIIEGRKINDGPSGGKAAVIYQSTAMLAYPFIFNDGNDAQRFLTRYGEGRGGFGDATEKEQFAMYEAWVDGERDAPSPKKDDDLLAGSP
jgi:hypothetical protein